MFLLKFFSSRHRWFVQFFFFGVACFVPVWQHSSFRSLPLRTARVRTCMMTWIPDPRVTVLCRVVQMVMLVFAPWRAKQDVDGNLSFIRNVTHWHRLFCCRTVALCVHTQRWRSCRDEAGSDVRIMAILRDCTSSLQQHVEFQSAAFKCT